MIVGFLDLDSVGWVSTVYGVFGRYLTFNFYGKQNPFFCLIYAFWFPFLLPVLSLFFRLYPVEIVQIILFRFRMMLNCSNGPRLICAYFGLKNKLIISKGRRFKDQRYTCDSQHYSFAYKLSRPTITSIKLKTGTKISSDQDFNCYGCRKRLGLHP